MPSNNLLSENLPHIMDSVFLWTGFRQPIAETESI